MASEDKSREDADDAAPLELPIDGVLDLHTFRPNEIKDLVPEYLEACRQRGIFRVRIIHGKGIGNLRRSVHAILAKQANVDSFALASTGFGGWGATIVHLRQGPGQTPAQAEAGPTTASTQQPEKGHEQLADSEED